MFSWLRDIVLPWKETTDVTKLAITALATGWVGRVERRPDLVNKGLQMYGVATGRLCHAIPASKPLQVLVTAGIFIIYELFEFGSQDNEVWERHMAGAAASVKASSLDELAMCPYTHIFDLCRAIIVSCEQSRCPPQVRHDRMH